MLAPTEGGGLSSEWAGFASLLVEVVQNTGIQKLQALDRSEPESVETLLMVIDNLLQYAESTEPNEAMYDI